jgi:hypothetical protein
MNEEFRPELISRRGEAIAWSLAAVSTAAWLIMRWRVSETPGAALVFVLFLLFAASSISLGNWMDRQTVLRLGVDGVAFRNGLRDVSLRWDEIWEVRVIPARWGDRVQVLGEFAHFQFRTLGEVMLQGELKGRMGFAEGETILQRILSASGLQEIEKTDQVRYYARP